MKNTSLKSRFFFLAGLFVLLSVFVAVMNADAQTKKRKKKTNAKPVATATPIVQPQNEPTVISRAEDLQNENQTIDTENQLRLDQTENQVTGNTTDSAQSTIDELRERIKMLESANKSDEKQKRLLLNLDILSRAETRAETLRKQLFDLIEKENSVRAKIEQLNVDLLPQNIERSVALQGSLRADEARAQRQRTLEAEKRNQEALLTQITSTRASLEASVQKADMLVEKVRLKLEKEIDDALTVDDNQ